MTKKLRLGEILVGSGIISDQQLRQGLAYQNQWGVQLGEALVTLGFITEVDLLKVLAKQLQLPAVNLAKTFISPDTIKMVRAEIADKHCIIPLGKRVEKGQEVLLVASADPTNLVLLDEIRFLINLPVKFVIATRTSIKKSIQKFYLHQDVDFNKGVDDRLQKIKTMKPEEMVVIRDDKSSGTFNPPTNAEIAAKAAPPPKGDTESVALPPGVSKEFQALLKLLIRKGVISRSEYVNELKKLGGGEPQG